MRLAVETPGTVIARIALILDAFNGSGRLTLSQIARRTGLPRSSTHRMLDQLVQLRWVSRDGCDYELGMGLIELGSLALHQGRIHQAAIPLLHDLHRVTGLVVHLAVLDGSDVVYLEKIGDRLITTIPTRVGGRQPAQCTAVGKAILAYTDDARIDLTARNTRYSIASARQLTEDLARVRAHGVAFEREESLIGFGCVAAPIGPPGQAVAAVSVCGPMSRMTFDQRLAAPVRMAAAATWRNAQNRSAHIASDLPSSQPPLTALART